MRQAPALLVVCFVVAYCTQNDSPFHTHTLNKNDTALLNNLEELFTHKNYTEIIKVLERKNAKHYKFQLLLAQCYLKKQEYSEALRALHTHTKAFETSAIPEIEKAHFHSLLGYTYEQTNNPKEALKQHLLAHKHFPKDSSGLGNIGRVYLRMGKHKAAKKYYLKAHLFNKDSETPLHALGKLAVLDRDFPQAKHYYQKALQTNPKRAELYLEYARVLSHLDEKNKAHEMQAKGHYLQGEFTKSLDECRQISSLYSDPELLQMYISLLIQLKKTEDAKRAIDFGIRRFQEDDEFLVNKVHVLLQEGDTGQALRVLKEVLHRFPESHSLYVLKGRAHEIVKQEDEALKAYSQAIRIKDNDIHAREYIAQYHRKRGNNNHEFFHQGIIYYYTQDFKQAEVVLGWVRPDFENKSHLYYYQALVAIKLKKTNTALTFLEQSIQNDPTFHPGYLSLAELHIESHQKEKARHLLQSFLRNSGIQNEHIRKQFTSRLNNL